MTISCSYHPTQPASWACDSCDQYFCEDCVVVRNHRQYGMEKNFHLCPKCNQEVDWIGVSNILSPFWTRLPSFFLYPFSIRPLLLNLMLCGVMFVFPGTSLFNMLIQFVLWGVWLTYAFASLKTTARGDMNPPPISMDTLSSDLDVIFKQLTIYIIMGFIIGLAVALLGKVAGLIAGMLALLLLPAMVILLVSTKRLIQAMNPGDFITLPMRIGGGYLAMYFFLVLLGGGPTVIFNLTKGMLPMAVLPFLIAFFQNYYTLMSYNLMGYVLLQYHEEIGYELNYEDFHCQGGPPKRLRPSSPLLTEVEVHIKDGNFGRAMDLLETEIKVKESRNLDLHERYYNLLKLQNLKEKWHEQAMEYIDLLVEADNREKACQVYLECSASDAGFAPSAKGLIRLGGWLKACGQAREAIRAYAAFNREYNKDPRVPLVCFRAAEIFNETFGQKTKARGLLQGIVNTYPDHDIVPSVRNYMSRIRG